jgi:hypothetical protein
MGQFQQRPHTQGESKQPPSSCESREATRSDWYKGLVLGLAVTGSYTETVAAQESRLYPIFPPASTDKWDQGSQARFNGPAPTGEEPLKTPPFISQPGEVSAADGRDELLKAYSSMTGSSLTESRETLKDKSDTELLIIVAELHIEAAKAENQKTGKRNVLLDDVLRKLDALDQFTVPKTRTVVSPHTPRKEEVNPSEPELVNWNNLKQAVLFACFAAGSIGMFYRTYLTAMVERRKVTRLWSRFESDLSKPPEAGIGGGGEYELGMNQLKLCSEFKDRVPHDLSKTLAQFGLEPRLVVRGNILQWNSRVITFGEIDSSTVGVIVNFDRFKDLKGLSMALGKRYLGKHSEFASFVPSIFRSAKEQLLHEPNLNGSWKKKDEWKQRCEFFSRWSARLGGSDTEVFERLKSAAALPKNVLSAYLDAERSLMDMLSSPADIETNLETLDGQLAHLAALRTSDSVTARDRATVSNLAKGL